MRSYYIEIAEKMQKALECAERLVDILDKDFSEIKYISEEEICQIEFDIFNEKIANFLEKRDLSSLKLINFNEDKLIYEFTCEIIVVITFYGGK